MRYGIFLLIAPVFAQLGPSGGGAGAGGTRAQQLPLSGRTQGSQVSVGQSSTGGAGAGSVNTLNSSVQVSGTVQGSVPGGDSVTEQAVSLTLAQAVQRGLKFNLSALSASSSQREANAGRLSARAQLLPDIGGDLRETVQQTNLAATGLRFSGVSLGPGQTFSFPSIVGPYNYFDLRASLSQSVADLTKVHNYRSTREVARSASLIAADTRELIVLAVTGAYLQVTARQSRVDMAKAQIATAKASYDQAVDRNKSGLNARIDVNRSRVELQTQQQRLNSLLNDLAKDKIALARLIGFPQGQSILLTDTQPFNPKDKIAGLNELIQTAWDKRSDVQAANAQVHAAEETRRAATSEYLPSLSLSADYGVIGVNPSQSHGTFSVMGSVHVPIWRSGRIEADVEQANAALALRKSELADLKGRVEQDVRNAWLDVNTAAEQIELAESNRTLAGETVEQASDRFRVGLADTIEAVQAQESLATAQQDYISALYSYQLARAALARAIGAAEKDIH